MKSVIKQSRISMGILLPMLVVLIFGLSSVSIAETAKKQAKINFVDHGAIYKWQAEGKNAILIETIDDRLFRAKFRFPCFDLPFEEEIAFVTSPRGQLNAFSSILTSNARCYFQSLEEVTDPTENSEEETKTQ